jgi:glycosyltransferase involved in cell wall biosynthesis
MCLHPSTTPLSSAKHEAVRVWQVCSSLAVTFGGISAACAQLTNHLSRAGAGVVVISLVDNHGPAWPLDPGVVAVRSSAAWPDRLGYSRGLAAHMRALAPPDVVHLHGLWRLHLVQAARSAGRADVPVIVTVHGMLHPPALRQRGAFKRAARWIFQDQVLRTARCLHATAKEEADEIRALGFSQPIAVIPWGVDMPAVERSHRSPAGSTDGRTDDRHVLLFLGRLHPTKGLETLLRAWARVFRRFPAWRLVLAGYDEGHYKAVLTALAGELGLDDSLSFAGPVEGVAREQLLTGASLLVLPSPSENFGFVVPEALARGVPVIATEGAPWSSLNAEACGWWIPVGDAPLAAALADAFSRPPDELRAMGERGMRFACAHFTWETVTASMLDLYAWARGAAPEPSFIQH